MKKLLPLTAILLLCCSHDLYIKLDDFRLRPQTMAKLQVFNGTFERSDNIVRRHRMRDMSLVGLGTRTHPDTTQWTDEGDVTMLHFRTGQPGTWVAGISTFPKDIKLAAKEFNEYLEHDGALDMLEWRKQNNALGQDAVEKYSKHVKAIFQVGDAKSDDWKTLLGYPIEFLPANNPYDLKTGDSFTVKLLWNGQPLPNQLVYVGSDLEQHDHSHLSGEVHTHKTTQFRTDAAGDISFPIGHEGIWYLRTIRLALSEEPGFTHESNWSTLTFQVGKPNAPHRHGLPAWAYAALGAVVVGLAYFFWKRKGK